MTREEQMMNAAEAYVEESEEIYNIVEAINDFCVGWREADSHPQWIPVEEELPKEGGEYFVSDGTDSMVDIWLHGIGWSKPDNNERVTHWMPKPLPPRNEE